MRFRDNLQHSNLREIRHRKPGDISLRRPPIKSKRLRRVLGIAGLYSAGYGDVGSSIYYALGIVVIAAMGATPLVLFGAGVLFICTALTYAEGATMLPEAGGSAGFARHGFNNHIGFVAAWALMLSYVVIISISAFTIPPYLGHFWEPLKTDPMIGTAVSIGIIFILMTIHTVGIRESSWVNFGAVVLDAVVEVSMIILGLILLFSPGIREFSGKNLVDNMFHNENWPSTTNLVYGIAVAALAYTGVETVSQRAEATRLPHIRVPKALILMIFTVLIMYSGISIVALSALSPETLATEWARDPVAGIAHTFPFESLRMVFEPMVAVLATVILMIACNAGLMGVSRLTSQMGRNQQLPSVLHHVYSRFKTPYIAILLFSAVAMLLLIPGLFGEDNKGIFSDIGGLYAFGALLSFAFAHLSILALRIRKPDWDRPFKLRGNIKIKGRELPVTALFGLVATIAVWLVIIAVQDFSRWAGFSWMLLGIGGYLIYHWGKGARVKARESPD